jgi:hypothetical protein
MNGRGDTRPEREKYPSASLAEQLRGELRALRRHPGIVLTAVLVLGGGVILNLVRPQDVAIRDLAAGDCLYIRADDAARDLDPGRPIGGDAAAIRALYAIGAERASCDLSHSHEVISATTFAEPAGAGYPGEAALVDRMGCEAGFTAYVGHAPDGSELELVFAVPDGAAWDAASRVGACLLARRDGEFMSGRARGSAR